MSTDWQKVKIGELGKVITGKTPSTAIPENFGGYYPFITIPDLDGHREIKTSARTLSELGAHAMRSCRLPVGAVMMSCIATVGKCGITTKESFTNQQINSLICKDGIDPRFVYYSFTQLGKALEATGGGGSVYTNVSKSRFEAIEIRLPPLKDQRSIAEVLSKLDDKIDLNRRINQTLEAMAQAIFKSWFVDFDPVKARIAAIEQGEDPLRAAMRAISGKTDTELDQMPREHHDQLTATAALFPDAMEESELGEIPKGWRIGSVDDLCISITSGGTPVRKNAEYWENGIIPWFKTGELHDGPLMDSEEHITEAALEGSSAKLWPAGTILFALYASPTVGRLGVLTQPGTSNQAAAGLVAKQEYGIPFLKRVLLDAREKLQNIAVGAAQQNINQGILKSHRVIVPCFELALAYSRHVAEKDEQQTLLATQSCTLAKLRDTLLPKLLSGELSVAEMADEVVLP